MKKSLHTDAHKVMLELLVQMRLSAGLRQQDLASQLGVPQSFISKYETGERRLDLIELRAICQALDFPVLNFIQSLENRLDDTKS